MGNIFEDLIRKSQEEMQSRFQGRNNVETNVNNAQSPKVNLLDLIRRTQEEMGRIRTLRENNSAIQNNSNFQKNASSTVSNVPNNNAPKTQKDVSNMINYMNKVNANQKQVEQKNFSNNINNPSNTKVAYLSEEDVKKAKKTTNKINWENSELVKSFKNLKENSVKGVKDIGKSIDDATNISGIMDNLGLGIKDAGINVIGYLDKAQRYISKENIASGVGNFIGNQFTKSGNEVYTDVKLPGDNEPLTVSELHGIAMGLEKIDPEKARLIHSYADKVYKERRETEISSKAKTKAKEFHKMVFEDDDKYTTGLLDWISDNTFDNEDFENQIQEEMQANINKGKNFVSRKLAELTGGMGNTILGATASVVNPVLGTLAFTSSAGGSYYKDAKERGMNDDQAFLYSSIMGGFEGLTEKYISGDMLSKGKKLITGKGLSKKMLQSFGVNIGENFLQESAIEPISELTAYVVGGNDTANFDELLPRMLSSGVDGALSALLFEGATIGVGSAVGAYRKGKNATRQDVVKGINDTISSGKVDVKSVFKNVVENMKKPAEVLREDYARNTNNLQDKGNSNNLVDVIKENINNNIDNSSNMNYNNTESDGGIDEQLQPRRILESFRSGIYENETLSEREYSRREYENWERTIKPIEQNKLSAKQQETITNIKRQYNKDIVFFDGSENNLYSGGASYTNPNRINIDINKAKVFGENKMIFHEIAESDIMHNRDLYNDILEPAIQKILSDNNFEKQKKIFWANEDGNIPNDYLIAKDILCDAYSKNKTGEELDYKNVLSNETNMTIKYALDNFYKQLNNNQNNDLNSLKIPIKYSIDNFTNINDKMSQNGFSEVLNNKKLPMQSFVYEKSDNTLVDTFRKDASRFLVNTDKARAFVSTIEKIITDKGISVRLNPNLRTNDGRVANGSYENGVITINPNSNRAGEFLAIHELTHAIGTKQMLDMVDNYRHLDTEFNEQVKSLIENYKASELTEEALADVSAQLFGTQEFINNLSEKNPNLFKRIYNEIKYLWHQFRGYKNQNQFINDLHYKWEQAYRKNSEFNDSKKYLILENDKGKFVKADRQVIKGNNSLEWETQVENYINDKIRNKQDVQVLTENGEILTITEDTSGKAKFRNQITDKNGNTRYLNNKEFLSKLTAETHIDELAQISKKINKKPVPDYKNHKFAKDGFDYRSAYFEDFDGQYYKITMSVGKNGNINTIYNIGKMDKKNRSNSSLVAQRPSNKFVTSNEESSSISSILPTKEDVNRNTTKYSMQESKNNSGSFKLPTKQWSQYLEDNFKATGTRTNLNEIKLPTREYFEKKNTNNMGLPTKEYFEKKTNENTKYSIQTDNDGNKYVKVDTDQNIFEGKNILEQTKIAKQYILDNFRDNELVFEDGTAIVTSKTANEYTHPKNNLPYKTKQSKLKASTELDNILNISKYEYSAKDDGRHKFAKDGWDYYKTVFEVDGVKFEGLINIAKAGEKRTFYDITQLKRISQNHSTSDKSFSVSLTNSNNSILPTKEDVNRNTTKYSMQESENNSGSFSLPTKAYFENKEKLDLLTDKDYEVLNKIYEKEGRTEVLTEKKKASLLEKYASDKFAIKESLDILAQKFVNKGHYVDKLAKESNNPELKFIYDKNLNSFAEGQYVVGVAQTDNKGNAIGKSINDIWKPLENNGLVKEFSEYLLHKHNMARSGQGKYIFGNEIGPTESTAISLKLEQEHPEFKEYAKSVKEFNHNNLNNLKESGLISQDMIDYLETMYPDYIVVSRNVEDSLYAKSNDSTGTGAPIKRATGGNADIQPIKDAMASQAIRIKRLINQNELGKELAKSLKNAKVEDNCDVQVSPSMILDMESMVEADSAGNKYYVYFEDGKQVKLKIGDDLFESLKPSQISRLEKTLPFRAVQKVSSVHRSLLTSSNPIFVVTNFFKDFQDGWFNSKYSKKFIKNYGKAFHEIYTKGRYYQSYMANGGMTNTYFDYNEGVKKKSNKFVEKIRNTNEIVEELPRLAEFISTLEDGKSLNEALYNAADITTNFKRGGDITKAINRNGVNFLNASVQGLDKFYRNISGQNGIKGYVNLLAKATIMSIAPAILNHILLDDDEDYQDLPQSTKDLYYLFKTGDRKVY